MPTSEVSKDNVNSWRRLQDEALRAHEAFVNAARGAAVARYRGESHRANSLTQLARKQHNRWLEVSRTMQRFETRVS